MLSLKGCDNSLNTGRNIPPVDYVKQPQYNYTSVMKKLLLSLVFTTFLTITQLLAQSGDSGDFMRSIGKIYVVVAVIIAMFIGIVFYLISLDRKLTKLENQIIDNE